MGLLSLFKSNKNYLEVLVAELKQDKERLLKEVEELKEQLNNIQQVTIKEETIKQEKSNKLTKLEQTIYDIIKNKDPQTLDELCKFAKIRKNTMNVYLSKMRKKGLEINFR